MKKDWLIYPCVHVERRRQGNPTHHNVRDVAITAGSTNAGIDVRTVEYTCRGESPCHFSYQSSSQRFLSQKGRPTFSFNRAYISTDTKAVDNHRHQYQWTSAPQCSHPPTSPILSPSPPNAGSSRTTSRINTSCPSVVDREAVWDRSNPPFPPPSASLLLSFAAPLSLPFLHPHQTHPTTRNPRQAMIILTYVPPVGKSV